MIWLLVITMILTVILVSPISMQIHATVKETKQTFIIKMFFYRIRLYTIERTLILDNQDSIWGLLENIEAQGISHFRPGKGVIYDIWHDMSQFLARVKVKRLSWKTSIGRNEALWAGLYTAILWTVKGFVIHLLARQTKLKRRPITEIIPYFQRRYFHSEFDCMVSMRTGQAIHILWSILTKK